MGRSWWGSLHPRLSLGNELLLHSSLGIWGDFGGAKDTEMRKFTDSVTSVLLSFLSLRTRGLREKKIPTKWVVKQEADIVVPGPEWGLWSLSCFSPEWTDWNFSAIWDVLPTSWKLLGSYPWRQDLSERSWLISWDKSPWHSVLTALPRFPDKGVNLIWIFGCRCHLPPATGWRTLISFV